jgi:hypothetical protein
MAIRGETMAEWDELIDLERRTVSPRVFTDPDIYRAEQERVFGRCWLYVAHESQIPQLGDFVTNYMGEEPVIVCRDVDGRVRVFINSCRHRGMRVCRIRTDWSDGRNPKISVGRCGFSRAARLTTLLVKCSTLTGE